ncbi:MAG: transcriptional regulator, MarR family [Ramlibacter sp.]|jgi:DNA-binding MarR family transcriptional regulator|uniref:MarR family winged helix-turn-helix transcriptional regulator n=1 Tax=Ramlibacter sp. TaxID=1917967 RepID=UPI002613ACF9|nr:MarR family transcriptional regulator [Ramlibacter sp.]MDB5751763.1 transcriptional regulator, MarR family [Ramlibacter sp.]
MPAPSPPEATVFYRPETYDPEDSAAYLMRRILACVATEVDAALEPRGLTSAQWIPLLKLHLGHAATVAELARECRLDAGAMTRMVDRLEAKGLVARARSSQDRRVVHLALTEAGSASASQIPAELCKVQNALLQGLSIAEWEQLKGLLHRVLDTALARKAGQP